LRQKNGNVSSTVWQVAGRDKQAYGFAYDDLNRLTEAKYFDIVGTANTFSTDNKFSEKLTYDLRGNILSLQRRGMNLTTASWTQNQYVAANYGLIDNLTYTYSGGKNQLTRVDDASLGNKGFKTHAGATGNQYAYDANGNLTMDKNKYITAMEYNYLNLPIRIVVNKPNDVANSGSIEFVYDATGVKLRKIVKNSTGVVKETRDYVNGVEYKDRLLDRITHSEGAVVRNEHGAYEHQYHLRDHLGNVRVTFRDGVNKGEPYEDWSNGWFAIPVNPNANNPTYNDGIVTTTDLVQINNYYPFGLNMEGDWNGSQGKNKYQYNGKEWNDDFGLGWNDYGARFYDATISRFSTQDRFAEKYIVVNPYQYGANNPIRFIDMNGDSIDIFDPSGNFMYTFDNGSGKSTTEGMMFTKSKTNKDGSITYSDPISFGYNDPDEDHKSVITDGYGAKVISDETINNMVTKSGVNSSDAQTNPADYAARESRPAGNSAHYTLGFGKKGEGKMDYFSQNPDDIASKTLHIITKNGKSSAYNPKDFGNYMWGYGMKLLGFSLSTAQNAAHTNNMLSSGRSDGGERTFFDSYGDQRAIKDGHNRGTNVNLTNGVGTHTYWTAQTKK
jgi:RHS repeat-associated protein